MAGVQLESSWMGHIGDEFEKDYMRSLKAFLKEEKQKGIRIFPPGSLIFNALNTTSFDRVKVVLLGQDPYHGVGQAHGLSFSVPDGVAVPPSLQNMYKELEADIPGFRIPAHGNLTRWAEQGVLLLNATLTVRAGQAGSHQNKGWETFTDKVISTVSAEKTGVVFLLWGRYARAKKILIDASRHQILEAPHPSPFSASYGFFGCRHFSKANEYLRQNGEEPIDWQL